MAAAAIAACSDPAEPVEEIVPPFSVAAKLGDADPGITILRSDGSIESRITCPAPCPGLGAARWSQDGRKLSATARYADRSVLFVVSRDGSGLKEVASVDTFTIEAGFRTPPPSRPYLYESWSSMDGRLAYVRTSATGYAIEIVAEDGTSRKTVFSDPVAPGIEYQTRVTRPRWRPSDATISFVNDARIYIMSADGTNLRVLSDTVVFFYDGVSHEWSPNGGMVAFTRGFAGSARNLMIHDVAAGVTRKILSGVHFGKSICWSPSSARVAFVVTNQEDFTDDIVTINADGTGWREEVRDLSPRYGSDRSIGWSPDGKYLVYQVSEEGKLAGSIRARNVLSGADIPMGGVSNVHSFVVETRGCL